MQGTDKNNIITQQREISILPVVDNVLFPYNIVPLVVNDSGGISLIDESVKADRIIGHFAVRGEVSEENLKTYDIYDVGIIGEVMKLVRNQDGSVKILLQGNARCKLVRFTQRKPFFKAIVEIMQEDNSRSEEIEALMRTVKNLFFKVYLQSQQIPQEVGLVLESLEDPIKIAYLVSGYITTTLYEKQRILEAKTIKEQLERLLILLSKEEHILKIESSIQEEVQKEIGKMQREHILKEQLKVIQKELGIRDEREIEREELLKKLEKIKMPDEAKEQATREINRLINISTYSAEYTVAKTYIDWLMNMPWGVYTEDNLDLKNARRVLDEDHYGLESVKDRIIEYLSVSKYKGEIKGSVICFVGPPGVGKTSLGQSIARALGRRFVRMSLGGVHDEAEIRGHRRTYVGALPGRIIQAIRRAGSSNPVMMLDEIDKLGADYRGNPESALLEVLDPEQNYKFSDNYLEINFDLSKTLFITTANTLYGIHPALVDRMECIELPGYSEEEKIWIAEKYLLPKQMKEHGLNTKQIKITRFALRYIIRNYTREAGLRDLERHIAKICRKVVRKITTRTNYDKRIDEKDVSKFLGAPEYFEETIERVKEPGIGIGLAWTSNGGKILFVEATKIEGSSGLTLTGSLGDVLKESAQAALSHIKSNLEEYKIKKETLQNSEIHIHLPSGAIPKDGPSAGLTIAISLLSLLKGVPARSDVAMTGEITLSGKVLPVGGVKDKVLAAKRAGISTVILPLWCKKEVDELPKDVKRTLNFFYVKNIKEAVKVAIQD